MSQRQAEIRQGLVEDVFQIRDTLEAGRNSGNEFPLPPPDYPYALQYMMDLIAAGFCYVAAIDKQIIGVVMLDRARFPWGHPSKTHFLENVHFWVHPDHRKGGTAAKLLDRAKSVAAFHKVPLRIAVNHPDGGGKTKDRWMAMQGFAYTGGNFWCNNSA